MLGRVAGGAVRLAPAAETIVIGEGIETTLAAMQHTGLPGWAALSTSGLMRLVPPAIVGTVIIGLITMRTTLANGRRVPRQIGGSLRAAVYGSRCRPSLCSPAAPMRVSGRCTMPPDGAADVRRLIDEAPELTLEPPRPLMREIPPADPFPIDALGSILGNAAGAIHDRVQAPLAVLSGAAHSRLRPMPTSSLQSDQAGKPISNFFVTVAETDERKSECDAHALWPIRRA